MRFAWCSLLWLLLVPPSCLGEVQHLSIILRPRHFVHPRDSPDFLCGLQSELDTGRLLTELSSPYILQLLDNTEDPDTRYRTTVKDIAFLTPTGAIHMTPSPCTASCHALFALVIVPPTGSCYNGVFSDAAILGKDHIVLYVGASLPDDVLAKYRDQADKLAGLYGGEMPRLCVIQSLMEASVAESRVASLTALFNFPFDGADRRLGNQDLRCTTSTETEQSLAFSGIFDYNPGGVTFEKENDTVLEETGRCETNIGRLTTGKVGVAFVETTLATANKSDLVPFNGPVAFSSGSSSASFITQIKVDDVHEEDELFSFTFKGVSNRTKRMDRDIATRTITELVNWPIQTEAIYPISGVTALAARTEVLNDNGILTLTNGHLIGYCRDCRGNCNDDDFGNNNNCRTFLTNLKNLDLNPKKKFVILASVQNKCNWNFFFKSGSEGPIWIQHHPEGHNFINPDVVTTPNHAYTTNTLPNMAHTAARPNPALNYNPHWHVRPFKWRDAYTEILDNNFKRFADFKRELKKYETNPFLPCNRLALSDLFNVDNDNNEPTRGITGRVVRAHYFYDMTLG